VVASSCAPFLLRRVWSAEQVGLALARLVVALLVGDDAPVLVVVDDTLFKRAGKKVWAAGWFHDGSAKGPKQVGYGNNWVIAGIIVTLPMVGPAGVPAGSGPPRGEEHRVGLPAVAGPPDDRPTRRGPARAAGRRGR
jgi:hypothetical protein